MIDKICIIGLGYVGLPLSVVLAEKLHVVGFDINEHRVEELKAGHSKLQSLGINPI